MFWTSWVLWEKLCFGLGCAIVLTVCAGCVKLVYKHFQMRKYTAIAAQRREVQPEMQHTTSVRRGRAADIPFGIRAIESGLEVDGVWISRSNTPTPSSPASLTFQDNVEPKLSNDPHIPERTYTSNIPQLAMPQPVRGYSGAVSTRSSVVSKSPESHSHQRISSERLPSRNASPVSDTTTRVRPNYRPRQSSHLRYSSVDILEEAILANGGDRGQAGVVQGLEGSSLERQHRRTSGLSEGSANTQRHYIPRRPDESKISNSVNYRGVHSGPVHVRHNSDGGWGRPEINANWQHDYGVQPSQIYPHRQSNGNVDHLTLTGSGSDVKSDLSEYDASRNPSFPNRTVDSSPVPASALVHDYDPLEPSSFQEFLESDPGNLKRQTIPLLIERDDAPSKSEVQPLQNGDPNRQARQSQVVRKVNSGFEILRPGTFYTRRQSSENSDAGPELENGDKASPKRLRKKRGESITGRTPQLSEEVS